jgi:hypothetical protein
MKISVLKNVGILFFIISLSVFCHGASKLIPIRAISDLDIGESRDIHLSNGDVVKLELLEIHETRDDLCDAIRAAYVKISIDAKEIILSSGNYNLPVVVGNVQIDCPAIKGYYPNSNKDRWGLSKDARFRLWPKGSPYIKPGTFVCPVKQDWLASMTQSGNEPVYVDACEFPEIRKIYYHSGFDIGGTEGEDEIVSATDGMIISANKEILDGYNDMPGDVRKDVVYVVDNRGWYYRYSHLDSIAPEIKPGVKVEMGQRIGFMGKQGHSGGWVHLHFEIKNKETSSGNWGTEDAYAYAWESYVHQYNPALMAVARPHQIVWVGQETTLDGGKSKSLAGDIVSYEWIFSDETTAAGAVQKKSYKKPGGYSEILKVTDSKGNVDYDFTVVQVFDKKNRGKRIPAIHASFYPTLGIKPGDTITFFVRTFHGDTGNEVWDFGDGTPKVSVKSESVDHEDPTKGKYAETVHSFSNPGRYIVKVERSNEHGYVATAHLHVVVGL